MSTIVVVRKNGVAAIGADTLTRSGHIKESAEYIANTSKILRVGESYLAYVGDASLGLVLGSYFSRLAEPPALDSPLSIFEAARELHQALKDVYFLVTEGEDSGDFEPSHACCLIANRAGIFGLYTRRTVKEYTRFYAFGPGEEYAMGAMWAVYETATSAEEVARAGLGAAAAFDDSTSLPIEVRTVRLLGK